MESVRIVYKNNDKTQKMRCVARTLVLCFIALFAIPTSGHSQACGGDKIFVSEFNSTVIRRANLDGTGTVIQNGSGSGNYNIEIDSELPGLRYLIAFDSMFITRSNLDDLAETSFYNQADNPFPFTVDTTNGFMYWADWDANASIYCAPADGSGPVTVVANGLFFPTALKVDPVNNQLYMAQSNLFPRRILRGAINGCSNVAFGAFLQSNNIGLAFDIEVDPANNRIFWTSFFNNRIGTVGMDGTTGLNFSLRSGFGSNPTNVELHQGSDSLYWVGRNGVVQRGASDGSGANVNVMNTSNAAWGLDICEDIIIGPILQSFTSSTADNTYGPGSIINLSANYDVPLGVGSTMTVQLDNGVNIVLNNISGSSLSASYTVGTTGSTQDTSDLTVSSITVESVTNLSGSIRNNSAIPTGNNLGDNSAIIIDVTTPTITSFTSSTSNDTYGPGSVINITANYDEDVAPGSSLSVTLDNGGTATLNSVSGSSISGSYTVGATGSLQDTLDLTVNSINSHSATDLYSNSTTSTLIPVNNLGNNSNIAIDTTAPTLTQQTAVTNPSPDSTPDYVYSSTEAGTASFGGACDSADTGASNGNNTVTLDSDGALTPLADGIYSNCNIQVTDGAGNLSNLLAINTFTVAATIPSVTLAINTATIAENGGVATVSATLSNTYANPVTVNLSFSGAASGTDYIASNTQIVIPALGTTGSITITGDDDSLDEASESIIVDISSITNGTEAVAQQVTTSIIDDDLPPSVSLSVSVGTIAENGGVASFTATLSAMSGQNVLVNLNFAGDAIGGGVDYSASGSSITIAAGALSNSITVTGVDDGLVELTEPIAVTATSVLNAIDNTTIQQTDVIDDDPPAPGGVFPNIEFWLKSDETGTAFNDGDRVQTWVDFTGNAHNASQATLANRPTFQSDTASLWNQNPVINFDRSSEHFFNIPNSNAINTGSQLEKTMFVAFRTGANVTDTQMVFEEGGAIRGLNLYISNNELSYGAWNLANDGANPDAPWGFLRCQAPLLPNTEYIAAFAMRGNATADGTLDCYLNGDLVDQETGVGRLFPHGGRIGVGAIDNDSYYHTGAANVGTADFFEGDIAEMIYYSSLALTTEEISRVNSYLGVKYGVTLNIPAPEDYANSAAVVTYATNGTHSGYDNDIAGIGLDITSNLDQPLSMSVNTDAIITMGGASDIGDREFLIWGNDNDDNGTIEEVSSGLAPGVETRLDRVWRVDQGGDVGTVSVSLDLNGIAVTGATAADFYMIIDATNSNFTSGATTVAASSYIGGIVTFNGVDFTGDDYFTLGTSITVPSVTLAATTGSMAENGGSDTFVATLNAVALLGVTVDLAYSGSADGLGVDYTASGTQIVIAPGLLTGSITIASDDDGFDEPNETVIADITSVTNGTESGVQQATTTIIDDDGTPEVTLSVTGASPVEAGGVATFTATLSTTSSLDITVDLGFSGSATPGGTDYTVSGNQIVIPAGMVSGSITATADQDLLDEDNETIVVDIDSVTNGTENGTQQQTATILDDDDPPTVTLNVGSPTIVEASGSTSFTAELNTVSGRDVTVNLTFSGTADGGGIDYNTTATAIVITAGQISNAITVTAAQETLYEVNESIVVDIDTVTNGTESTAQQETTTIIDDDTLPTVTLAVNTPTFTEVGPGVAVFTATVSPVSGATTTVSLALSGGATVGSDYNISSTSIIIAAGATTGTATVTAIDDLDIELDETLTIDISAVNNGSEGSPGQATTTLQSDDFGCNIDPFLAPAGLTGYYAATADEIFTLPPTYQSPPGTDFDTNIMGRDAAGAAAQKALAVSYFQNRFGVDFSGSDLSPDGNVFLIHFASDSIWDLNIDAASDFRLEPNGGTLHLGSYMMLVVGASTTLHGTWGGVGGTVVPNGVIAEFGEYQLELPIPCSDSSTITQSLHMDFQSIEPTFIDADNEHPAQLEYEVSGPAFPTTGFADGTRIFIDLPNGDTHGIFTLIIRIP